MSNIVVNTEELRQAGQAFASARELIHEAINGAESKIQPCRTMVSTRVTEDVENWDLIKKKFLDSLENLGMAGQQIQQTGVDFDIVDQRGHS